MIEKMPIFSTYFSDTTVNKIIVGLHGWTGNEHSMKPVAIGSRIQGVKWYFPRGPYSMEGKNQFSWFTGTEELGWNCDKSFSMISDLMDTIQYVDKVDPKSIYFVGFSQGACIAMEAGLRLNSQLGGIIAIAGFIRHTSMIRNEITGVGKKTPVLILHGDRDTIVPPAASIDSRNLLKELGVDARLEMYHSGHKIPVSAYPKIRSFISGKE